jgi:hypothetical protein
LIETIIKIFAKNPPSIAIVFAGLLALAGQIKEAYDFLYAGLFMQCLWIAGKYLISKR